MKIKVKPEDTASKGGKVLGSKIIKTKVNKKKLVKHASTSISENSKADKMKKRAEMKMIENASEGSKNKQKKLKQNATDQPNGSPGDSQTPNEKKQKHFKKKKKTFNKEAIEKMKARQLAKKEKLMRQSSGPASPPKPEAKRRRPKLPVRLESVELKFSEDDDTMTQFEGTWVPREETGRLQSARDDLEKRGLPAEKVSRRMKQLVRREHRKLKIRLIAAQTKTERVARERRQLLEAQQTARVRRRVPGRACGLTLQEGDQLARFDGFWVSAEAVPRLETLRQKLRDEGKTDDEARRLLRKARRVEERKVKSSGRLVCTKCGGRGHLLSDCTARAVEAAGGTECFRCGRPGHRLSDCPSKGEIAGLPFATCFLCKQRGHMSRECPRAAAAGDAGQRPSGGGRRGGPQDWRGLTHDDAEVAATPAVQKSPAPPVAVSKQKARVHIRFD